MAEKEKSAGAIIYRKEGKKILYLLLYVKAHEHYREKWNFPRGNVEKGETEIETVKREVKEETGIEDLGFKKGFKEKIHFFYRKNGKGISKEVIYFLAETKTKEVKLSFEHNDFAWLSFEKAMERLTFNNDKEVLKKANAFLTKGSLEAYV